MSLPHFFAGAPELGETVTLEGDDAHHALRSLRLSVGDGFTSSDAAGGLAVCRIVRATGLRVHGEVEERTVERRPVPTISVLVAPPKGERLQWAVQKLTEVGIDRVVLLEADRSVRRWVGERAERVAGKLAAVAREAAKQSRRRFVPTVEGPVPWDEGVTAAARDGDLVVLWERAERPLATSLPARTERLSLVVGPEGGIPDEDARAAERQGAALASLGPAVLRTETAALVGASLALSRYGRFG